MITIYLIIKINKLEFSNKDFYLNFCPTNEIVVLILVLWIHWSRKTT